MAESKKLSNEELQTIKSIQQGNQELMIEFGNIEIIKRRLEDRERRAENQYIDLQNKEQDFMKSLSEKYGDGSINLEKGTFTPMGDGAGEKKPSTETPITTFDNPVVQEYK